MVQALPELSDRFDIRIRPHLVEQLDARFFPAPQRYEAHAILDAGRYAALYGLGFPADARVPDRLAVGMASRYLASIEQEPDFFEIATEVGEGLWRYDLPRVRRYAASARMDDDHIRKNQRFLRQCGHWESGVLIYEGEAYKGLERLDHLERRLAAEGVQGGPVHFGLGRDLFHMLGEDIGRVAGKQLDLFWSPDSPYSYLALERAARFAARTGVILAVRPVRSGLFNSAANPHVQRVHALRDTAREARLYDIPFGRVAQPEDTASDRAIAYASALKDEDLDLQFLRIWGRHAWSRGNNGATREGWQSVIAASGLQGRIVSPPSDAFWRSILDRATSALQGAGGWDVPSFMVGHHLFWGQDRLWAAVKALAETD